MSARVPNQHFTGHPVFRCEHGDASASSYCSTKFAVEGITECLAIEVAPLGIHVTVVEPGYFSTE